MATRYTIKNMQSIAREHGAKCLSKEYINDSTPLAWMCQRGHTWDAPYSIVRQGGWCVQCAKKEARFEELQEIAEKRGGKCLSTEYINSTTKLKWQCKEGHVWMTSPHYIKYVHTWCRNCAITNQKDTIDNMKALAMSRGGECLSTKYVNKNTKLKWRCTEGHVWMARPQNIKPGGWCPQCVRKPKHTIEALQMLAKSLGGRCLSLKYLGYRIKLKWQCGEGHLWQATPFSLLQGRWCYKCGVKMAAEKRKNDIGIYKKLAEIRDGRLLSDEYINKNTKLKWQCKKGHEWMAIPHNIKNGSWCPYCAGKIKQTIEEMQMLAKQRGGKCLSLKYVNSQTKLKWQCNNGHIWMANPAIIRFGRWCAQCAFANKKNTIEDMNAIAISHGGKCLSVEYANSYTKLKWECQQGHIWHTTPSVIKNQNSWCPKCGIQRLLQTRRQNQQLRTATA
jgi:hypothetical protein